VKREPVTLSMAESCIETWKRLYVEGKWTLRDLEEHLEAILPTFRLEDWARR